VRVVYLAADEPEAAGRVVDQEMSRYTDQGVHIPHFWEFYARGQIMLYAGQGAEALGHVRARWPAFERSLLLRLQVVRIAANYLRGRCALCDAEQNTARRAERLGQALKRARVIEGEAMAWSAPLARLLRAGVAVQQGQLARAADQLEAAERQFEARQMTLYEMSARSWRGLLLGGAEGDALRDAAHRWMIDQGIVRPEQMAAMLAPGLRAAR